MKNKLLSAMSLALIMAMLLTSVGLADNIVNDIAANVGSDTIVAGGSTVVGYKVVSNNGDGQTGCNAADSTPLTLTLSFSGNVSASGGTLLAGNKLKFITCNDFQYVTFTSNVAGNYPITTNYSDTGTGTYNDNSDWTLHVSGAVKTTPTITWSNPADIVYGTALSGTQLNATASVAGSFVYTPAAGTVLNAGTGQTLHADFTPSDTSLYNSASKDVTINVLKADPGCSISGYTGTYDGAAHGATGSCSGAGTLGLGASFTDVPGGTANWKFTASNGNYNDASGSVAIVINKAGAGCSISGYTGTYDGAAHGATGSCTGVGTLDLGTKYTNVPGGNAHWTFTGNNNYSNAEGDVAITVSKASVTATAGSGTATYDGSAKSPSNCVLSGAFTGTLSCANNPASVGPNADTYTITPVVTGPDLANFDVTPVNGFFTIDQADALCTVNGYSVTYDGSEYTADGSCKGVQNEPLTGLDLSGTKHTKAGSYTDSWSFTDVTGNYKNSNGTVNDHISPKALTSTITADDKDYDNSDTATFTCALNGVVGSDDVHCTGGSATFASKNVGTWTVTATGLGLSGADKDNYTVNETATDTAEIKPLAITASITANDKVYDSTDTATFTCALTGVLGTDAVSCTGGSATFASKNVGTWTVTATGLGLSGTQAGNYSINTTATDTAKITKADASCVVNGYSVTYNGAEHQANGSCTGVGTDGVLVGLDLSGTKHTEAGSYTDGWTFTDVTGNYDNQSDSVLDVIAKAPVTATAGSGSGTYSGFVQSPSACVVSGAYKGDLTCTNNPSSVGPNAGTYAIAPSVSGTGLSNFDITPANGSYTINKANASCTITGYNVYFDNANHTATGSCKGVLNEILAGLDLSATTHKAVGSYTDPWTFTDVTGDYNNTSGTVNDKIGSWTFGGFYQPVDMPTATTTVYNTVKNGSTVPLKFEVFAGPTELTDVNLISATWSAVSCTGGTEDTVEVLATGNTTLRYDTTAGQFIFNWKTPTTANKCYRVTMTTLDGSTLSAYFKLK